MRKFIAALLAVGLAATPPAARAEGAEERYAEILRKFGPLVVHVKALIKTEITVEGEKQDSEDWSEMLGVIADPDGLVVVQVLPFVSSDPEETRTPLDVKVTIEGDALDHPAFLAAKDSKLGLAFLQIEGLADRKLAAVDFTGAIEPRVGQEVVSVGRGGEELDFVTYFELARVCGKLKRPQRGWLLSGDTEGYGLPAFTLAGELAGFLTSIAAIQADGEAPDEEDYFRALLPASTVKGVIDAARRIAAQMAIERATGKKATPVEPGK